jgi:hypothetical protein
VRCLQIRDTPRTSLPIPESEDSFEALIAAQARGDAEALAQRRRSVFVLDLGERGASALGSLRAETATSAAAGR